jgi:hypothetical protein
LDELDQLEKERQGGTAQQGVLYLRLSNILRAFLERQFPLPVSRLTTREFQSQVAQADLFSPEQQILLGTILDRCDLAKFARANFKPEDLILSLAKARLFIQGIASANAGRLPSPGPHLPGA